jgi:hypothetical protein
VGAAAAEPRLAFFARDAALAYTLVMKLAVLVILLVAACRADSDDFPIGPGGGGGGGGGGGDAGVGDGASDAVDGDAGVPISGRVCIITDLRFPTVCDSTANAESLLVSIGVTRTAKPNARGDFTIAAPLGQFTWRVTGLNFITSVIPLGGDTTLPVISDVLYTELLAANRVTLIDQEGSIVVRVVRGVGAVQNVTAVSNPATTDLAFYDDRNVLDWRSDLVGTGPAGVVWLPDVPLAARPPTQATVTLTPSGASSTSITATVENQAITFVTADL